MASPIKTRRRSAPPEHAAGQAAGPSRGNTASKQLSHSTAGQQAQTTPNTQAAAAGQLPPLWTLPPPAAGKDAYQRPIPGPQHISTQLQIGQTIHCCLKAPHKSPPLRLALRVDALLAHEAYSMLYRVSTDQPQGNYLLRIFLSSTDMGLQGAAADCHDFHMAGVCAEELSLLNRVYSNMHYALDAPDKGTLPKTYGQVTVLDRHAMLLSDGTATLRQLLQGGQQLPMPVFKDITKQLLAILESSSRLGITHGNLCTGNIVLSELPPAAGSAAPSNAAGSAPRYQVVLLGFCAKACYTAGNSNQPAGGLLGPYSRAAPEVDEGHSYTVKADVFQLGMLLLEMLTGCDAYEHLRDRMLPWLQQEKEAQHWCLLKHEVSNFLLELGEANPFRALPARCKNFVRPLLLPPTSRTVYATVRAAAFLTASEPQPRKKRGAEAQKGSRKKLPVIVIDEDE